MKNIKIGELNCSIVTGTEINYKRQVAFDNYFRLITEDLNELQFSILHEKVKKAIDKGQLSTIALLMNDFSLGIKIKDPQSDYYGLAFCLICSENGEDLSIIEENFLKEKLEKFSKSGLSYITVKEEIENFIKASPLKYTIYMMRASGLIMK
jgi:hypothetical protein